jgi:hypothetical protein
MDEEQLLNDQQVDAVIMDYLANRIGGATEDELYAAVRMECQFVITSALRNMAYAGELNVAMNKDDEVTYHRADEVVH